MFIQDVDLIHQNSVKYNGKDHNLTATAKKMLDTCLAAIQEVSTGLIVTNNLSLNFRHSLRTVKLNAECSKACILKLLNFSLRLLV